MTLEIAFTEDAAVWRQGTYYNGDGVEDYLSSVRTFGSRRSLLALSDRLPPEPDSSCGSAPTSEGCALPLAFAGAPSLSLGPDLQLRAAGKDLADAVIEASVMRLRPILMTTGAMVLGAVPLALACSDVTTNPAARRTCWQRGRPQAQRARLQEQVGAAAAARAATRAGAKAPRR